MYSASLSDFEGVLSKHIDKDFKIFPAGNDAPKEQTFSEFEDQIGFPLPDDFRMFSCSWLGGVYIEVKEEVWPRHKEYAVGPYWSFLYGMFVYALSPKAPDWMSIEGKIPWFREHTGTNYVPFLKLIGVADIYCFDEAGDVRRWDHETGEAPLQNKTFFEVFSYEVAELKGRKEQKKALLKSKHDSK